MSHGIYSALSGAVARANSLDTIAGNLANANTTGYRALRPMFQEVLEGTEATGDEGSYAAQGRTVIDTTPGMSIRTGGSMDMRLPPDAFLAVRAEGGERYTRAGDLRVSPEGFVTTRAGELVLDESNEPIEVSPDAITRIEKDGAIATADGPVGQLKIVTFDNPERLTYEGNTLLAASAGSGRAQPNQVTLTVGELEGSNATPVRAMTTLIQANRMFEAMEKAIGHFRDIDQRLVTTVPK